MIATHFTASRVTAFDCQYVSNEYAPKENQSYETGASSFGDAHTAVDNFITNGGEFICWLSGHMHYDCFGICDSYENQIEIGVDTAQSVQAYNKKENRINGTKSQDAFNVVSFDTTAKLIKIFRIGCDFDSQMHKKELL